MARLAAKYRDDPEAAAFYALALAGARRSGRQNLRRSVEGRRDPREAVDARIPSIRGSRITSSTATTCRRSRRVRSRRRAATRRSRPTRRTPCTCRPTRSPVSATGRTRSTPTSCRPRPRARSARSARSCTRPTTRSTPTCRAARTPPRAGSWISRLRLLARRTRTPRAGAAPPTAGAYALAAIPARYALERGDWPAAARLEVRGRVASRYADAMTWFARAIGASRTARRAAARAAVDELQKAEQTA